MTEYTQGVAHDGAVILKDGVAMNIEEILDELQQKEAMKAPPSKRIEAITDLIFEWIGPEGCDQQQVASRLEYLLKETTPGLAKAGRLLHACEDLRDDLLLRADIRSDGTRAVNVSDSRWAQFNDAMDRMNTMLDEVTGDSVPIPQTAAKARAMALTGMRWLADNAPDDLQETNENGLQQVAEKVCRDIPDDMVLSLCMENGAAWVELGQDKVGSIELPDSADKTLGEQIDDALRVAMHRANLKEPAE